MAPSSSMPSSHHARGVWLMVSSAASFTINILLVRALGRMHVANVWFISSARFVVGLGLILLVFRNDFQPLHLFRSRKLIERGVVGGLGVYLTYLTVVKLGAGRAMFIGNTYVIWGALLAAWLLKERLKPGVIAGGLAALVGLGLLTDLFSTNAPRGFYDSLAFLAAWLSAYVIVVIRQLHALEHTSTIFAAQCVYGLALCAGPAAFAYEPLSPGAWAVLGLASISAGVGQLTMTFSFRDLPVAEGSVMQMLVPLGTAAGGMLFFGEHFTLREVAGAVLIFAGTAFTLVRQPTRATAGAE